MDESLINDPELKAEIDRADESFKESKKVFRDMIKTLYDNAGIDWTEKDDEKIDTIYHGILVKAAYESIIASGKIMQEVLVKK
jgi:hypothetical protein